MLDKLIDLSLKYRLLVIVLFISICALGFRAYKNIPVDAFPDITPNAQMDIKLSLIHI